jgi:hypothetical protein
MVFDVAGAGSGRAARRRAGMLALKIVLNGIRAMSPGQNQARQDYQRDNKNHRSGEAQRHDRENALMSVTATSAPPPGARWLGLAAFGRKWGPATWNYVADTLRPASESYAIKRSTGSALSDTV